MHTLLQQLGPAATMQQQQQQHFKEAELQQRPSGLTTFQPAMLQLVQSLLPAAAADAPGIQPVQLLANQLTLAGQLSWAHEHTTALQVRPPSAPHLAAPTLQQPELSLEQLVAAMKACSGLELAQTSSLHPTDGWAADTQPGLDQLLRVLLVLLESGQKTSCSVSC